MQGEQKQYAPRYGLYDNRSSYNPCNARRKHPDPKGSGIADGSEL